MQHNSTIDNDEMMKLFIKYYYIEDLNRDIYNIVVKNTGYNEYKETEKCVQIKIKVNGLSIYYELKKFINVMNAKVSPVIANACRGLGIKG